MAWLLRSRLLFAVCCAVGLLVLSGCSPVISTSVYAESVDAFDVCSSSNDHCEPSEVVDPPDATFSSGYISLGTEDGYIVAFMASEFTDGPGPDLRVYEVGDAVDSRAGDEPFDVFISRTGSSWIQVAEETENDEGKAYAAIDIAPHSGTYRYVKVVNRSSSGGSTPGADIDAIEALWASGFSLF